MPDSPKKAALRRIPAWLGRHAYLALAAGALLVLTRTVDFAPPTEVRRVELPIAPPAPADAPPAALRATMGADEAVQLRASLRLLEDPADVAAAVNHDPEAGRLLAQPVVATVLGVPAAIHQTVRVDDGDLEILVDLELTPRASKRELSVEHVLEVKSRRRGQARHGLHLRSEATFAGLDRGPYRVVFTAQDRLFELTLDLHRGG